MSAPTIDEKPWLVQRQYGDPLYFKTHGEALKRVQKDLRTLLDQFTRLKAHDAMASLQAGLDSLGESLPITGGSVDVLVDPYSNTRYRATLTKRAADW